MCSSTLHHPRTWGVSGLEHGLGCPVTTSFPNAWQKKMEYKDKNITLLFKLILFIMFFQVQFPDATFEETKMKEENHSRREIREADPPLLPALKLQDRLS